MINGIRISKLSQGKVGLIKPFDMKNVRQAGYSIKAPSEAFLPIYEEGEFKSHQARDYDVSMNTYLKVDWDEITIGTEKVLYFETDIKVSLPWEITMVFDRGLEMDAALSPEIIGHKDDGTLVFRLKNYGPYQLPLKGLETLGQIRFFETEKTGFPP